MLETMLNILSVFCIVLITILAVRYIAMHRDYRKGVLHKAGNLLLYGYLKAAVTIGYGREALRIRMQSIFRSYQPDNGRMKELHQKEQRMNQLRSGRTSAYGYGKKAGYNLKILK